MDKIWVMDEQSERKARGRARGSTTFAPPQGGAAITSPPDRVPPPPIRHNPRPYWLAKIGGLSAPDF